MVNGCSGEQLCTSDFCASADLEFVATFVAAAIRADESGEGSEVDALILHRMREDNCNVVRGCKWAPATDAMGRRDQPASWASCTADEGADQGVQATRQTLVAKEIHEQTPQNAQAASTQTQ